jgi:hypothetical protein
LKDGVAYRPGEGVLARIPTTRNRLTKLRG